MSIEQEFERIELQKSLAMQARDLNTQYSIFKFLIEPSYKIDYKYFCELFYANECNLARTVADYYHVPLSTNILQAVQSADQLFCCEEMIHKNWDNCSVEYVDGDAKIFSVFEKNLGFGKVKFLSNPGRYSNKAFLLALPSERLFVKPVESLEKALTEPRTYKLSKDFGLDQYFLPSCAVKVSSGQESFYAILIKSLPMDAISLDNLDRMKPGSNDGIIKRLIEEESFHKLGLFYYLIKNFDCHKNNIFVSGSNLYLIDHTESFNQRPKGFVPGFMRLSSFKNTKELPLAKSEASFNDWLSKINPSDESIKEGLKLIKSSETVNSLWLEYYKTCQ